MRHLTAIALLGLGLSAQTTFGAEPTTPAWSSAEHDLDTGTSRGSATISLGKAVVPLGTKIDVEMLRGPESRTRTRRGAGRPGRVLQDL